MQPDNLSTNKEKQSILSLMSLASKMKIRQNNWLFHVIMLLQLLVLWAMVTIFLLALAKGFLLLL